MSRTGTQPVFSENPACCTMPAGDGFTVFTQTPVYCVRLVRLDRYSLPGCGERGMAVDVGELRLADDCRAACCCGCLPEKSGVADLWKWRATSILQDLVDRREFRCWQSSVLQVVEVYGNEERYTSRLCRDGGEVRLWEYVYYTQHATGIESRHL